MADSKSSLTRLTLLLTVLVASCGDGPSVGMSVAGNWISAETFDSETGDESAKLRISLDPVEDRTMLSGLFSLGPVAGTVDDGILAGNDLSLELRSELGITVFTGRVQDGGIVGTLNGLAESSNSVRFSFNASSVTLIRGS